MCHTRKLCPADIHKGDPRLESYVNKKIIRQPRVIDDKPEIFKNPCKKNCLYEQ